MSHILVVDDRHDLGAHTVEALRKGGYLAELVCEPDMGSFYDTIRDNHFGEQRLQQFSVETWDALVLDIHFDSDHWGGIWLYNKLARDYRDCWNTTIIYSKYAGARLPKASIDDGDLFRLRIFIDTANIPADQVLDNVTGGRTKLIAKLTSLGIV